MIPRTPRCRWLRSPGEWSVHGRVERFVEPVLLVLLREGPRHGYELREEVPRVAGEGADLGNVYRMLRQLELEGIVTSAWGPLGAGPGRRTYQLTPSGRRLLDTWASALLATRSAIDQLLTRYDTGGAASAQPAENPAAGPTEAAARASRARGEGDRHA